MNDVASAQKGLRAFIEAYAAATGDPARGAARPDDVAVSETAHRLRPFPGLRSFEPDDSDVFFGRQDHTDSILGLLRDQQVIAVLGGSGSGKSSIVRAGVIPALTSTYKIEGRLGRWYVAVCKPGRRPIDELCDALWQQVCSGLVLNRPNGGAALAAALGAPGELRDRLKHKTSITDADKAELRRIFDQELRPGGELNIEAALWFASDVLDRLDREMNPTLRGGTPSLMLVIDQFEELFNPDVIVAQRDALLVLLKRVFDGSKDGTAEGFYITVTMRSEQLHRCAEFAGLSEIINGSMFLIDLIDDVALREAIWRPARRVCDRWGIAYDSTPTAPFEPQFIDWLAAESGKLRESLVHKPDQLPLMQHALRLIWANAVARWSTLIDAPAASVTIGSEDLPQAGAAADVGFMRGCLNVAANQALLDAAGLYAQEHGAGRDEGERLLRAFFISLARRDDRGNWARRLIKQGELREVLQDASLGPFDEARFRRALEVFVRGGYVMPRSQDDDASNLSYEVCHEALIRHWEKYQTWLEEVDEFSRSLRDVATNLLPPNDAEVPERWEDLEPYGESLGDRWSWLRAVKERRAAGYISEINRETLKLAFGPDAKFGAGWMINELTALLKARDRRREAGPKPEERYAAEASRLLAGIGQAFALLPARLSLPPLGTRRPRLEYLLAYARHPDNRLITYLGGALYVVFAIVVAAVSGLFLLYNNTVKNYAILQVQQQAGAQERARLVEARHYVGAQSTDRLMSSNNVELASLVAADVLAETAGHDKPQGRLRQSLAAIALAQSAGPLLSGTSAATRLVAVAPKGKYVAGVPAPMSQNERATKVQLWDTASGAAIRSLALRSEVTALAISADATKIAAGSRDGEVVVFEASSGNPVAEWWTGGASVSALSFSHDGLRLVGGASDSSMQIWNIGDGSDGKRLVIEPNDPSCSLSEQQQDSAEQRPADQPTAPPDDKTRVERRAAAPGFAAVALNAAGNRALASTDNRLMLWDVSSGKCLAVRTIDEAVRSISFGSRAGQAIVGSARGAQIATIADSDQGLSLKPIRFAGDEDIRSVGYDPAERKFTITGRSMAILMRERARPATTEPPADPNQAAQTEKSRNAASTRRPSAPPMTADTAWNDEIEALQMVPKTGVRLFGIDSTGGWLIVQPDANQRHPLQILQRDSDFFLYPGRAATVSPQAAVAAVSDDSRYTAVAAGPMVFVRREDGSLVTARAVGVVRSLRFDPGKRDLLIGLTNGTIQSWKFDAQPRPVTLFRAHADDVNSIAFDRTGTRIVTASDDRAIAIGEVGTRRYRRIPTLLRPPVRDARFAADDIGIVALSGDGTLSFYRTNGALEHRLQAVSEARSMALDRTGSRAIILGEADRVQIWNLRGRALEASIRLPDLSAIGFRESGEIFTVNHNGVVAIWSVDQARGGMQVKSRAGVSAVTGGWMVLNPSGTGTVAIEGSRTIHFDPEPKALGDDELHSIIRAAGTRSMTTAEFEDYGGLAEKRRSAQPKAPPPCNSPETCSTAVTRNPSDARAWQELGRLREGQRGVSRRERQTPDPAIIVAAALGDGVALGVLGEWFSARKPRSPHLSGVFYAGAILNDPKGGERYANLLVHAGDPARTRAWTSRELFERRAAARNAGAYFLLGLLAERPLGPPGEADLVQALFNFAVAEKIFDDDGIESTAASVRRAALARVIAPAVLVNTLKLADARVAGLEKSAGAPGRESWTPDLAGAAPTDEAIGILAGKALDALSRSFQLPADFEVLRAELLALQGRTSTIQGQAESILASARELFEKDLARDPGDATSFDRLDEILSQLGKTASATNCDGAVRARAEWLDRWLKPQNSTPARRVSQIEATTSLGVCLAGIGQTDAARAALRAASRHVRNHGDEAPAPDGVKIVDQSVAAAVEAAVRIGDRDALLALYAHQLARAQKQEQPADSSAKVDDYIGLQQKTLAALGRDPVSPEVARSFERFGSGIRELGAGQVAEQEKGQEVLQRDIAILETLAGATQQSNPEFAFTLAAAHRLLGEIQVKRDEREQAAKSFAEARARLKTVSASAAADAALMRSVIGTQRALADALRAGDLEGAIALYRDAIDTAKTLDARKTLDSSDRALVSDTYSEIGVALEEMERYEAAAEISDEWTRLRPNEARAWNALCWDKAILGKLQEALRHCDEALRLDSKDADSWDSRGFTYLKLGEFDKAISDYDRALAITDIAFSRYGRGLAKLRKGDTAGGEEDIAAAKALRSDIEPAFERVGGK